MRVRHAILLGLVLAAAGAARGEGVDLSSPQAAARSLYAAVHSADAPAIRSIFEGDAGLAGAFADLLVAGRKLQDAARDKFAGAGEKLAAPMMTPDDLAGIDSAVVTRLDEATITLTPAGQSRPIKFHRGADRQWRLDISDYAHASAEELPRHIELLKSMTQVMTSAAADIEAGKFHDADEAQAAIVAKFNTVMIAAAQRVPPATQP